MYADRIHDNDCDDSFLGHFHHTLASCTELIEAGDFSKSEQMLSELVVFLNSISDSIVNEPENQELENRAFQILTQIHKYLSSSVDQAVIDSLSFELPKAVARFGCASERCLENATCIVDIFTDKCSPRDMLSILCEALGSPGEMFRIPSFFTPLLSGLPKVFVSIRRRHFEQVKAALPVIINALKAISLDIDDEDTDPWDVFHKANCIADSIKAVCSLLEGKDKEKLDALLGLFVLQIMALVSIGMKHRVSQSLPLVLQLSHFLRYCGLSYTGLIIGTDVKKLMDIAMGDDGDDSVGCFSHIWHGASLAVIWGYKSKEVAVAADADLTAVKVELQSSQMKRWQAVGSLKHIFLCIKLPWNFKQDAVNFLLSIMDGNLSQISDDENADCSIYMPTLYASLQALQVVIMHSSNVMLRKNAFAAFKKLLTDVPSSPRLDILRALIKNSDSSSMIAVLLDCIKEELHTENANRNPVANKDLKPESQACQGTCFWSASVLELIELVLRPPEGGPPPLPEFCDAVLAALNLYRFVLITESTGKTNYTGVLSKNNLLRAYNEWLLPLRTLVTGIAVENRKDWDQLSSDILCGLNPVELVLYRCIELVEEHVKIFS
ncbi:hypothetical protein ACH5RR_040043 [Cinchona calisaya]|uniref:Aberrant root formation protein 4 n=1 Tax=Cinchona calisaya TaxID=153742 RepID=A0ABD2XSC2_9GENT